jgi:hypothetical protein
MSFIRQNNETFYEDPITTYLSAYFMQNELVAKEDLLSIKNRYHNNAAFLALK